MCKKVISILFFVIFTTSSVFSDSYVGRVQNLYINSSGTVLVRLNNGEVGMNCGQTTWPLEFHVDGVSADHWISMLITARAQDKNIRVSYAAQESSRCSPQNFSFYGFDN